ncbi:B3 domain-containing protein At2g31420-like [Hevea brasiliensis]|uniref:B3 domain-containing protein At2g31420-like n=1 Tax=Hevea brasiliensis TaxID=3981 RepID=UPI0025EF7C47|nr:B3 domain-containing protein At2g31420-like [Hevea brasiliensis]
MNEIKRRVCGKRCSESGNNTEDEQKKRKLLKRPNRTCFANIGSETPPDVPDEWWDKIRTKGGTDVKLVIMKQMFTTDLNPHHDRFSIPFKQIRDSNFLTEDEKSKLKEQKENIPVTLMEPCGDESKMLLRQWNLKSSSTYVLTSSWKKVLERNHQGSSGKFKQNDIVQLWSFRRNGELWLALFKVGDASTTPSGSGSKGENGDGANFLLATTFGKVEIKGPGKLATSFKRTKVAAYTLSATTSKALIDLEDGSHPYEK